MANTHPAQRIETTLQQDGKLTLEHLPFRAGQAVEVIILPQFPSRLTNPYPLRGTPFQYERPTDPVAEEDWEAMNRRECYREIVRRLIEEYASYKPSHGQIETEAVIDRDRDHYEVLHVGWDGVRRVHGSVVHVDIIGGKVWVQYDGTTRPIAEELVVAGIPREDIVLGFQPAEVRPHTNFAVG